MEHVEHEDQHEESVGDAADPLLELRIALDGIDELSLDERAQVFDRTHAVVVEELRTLELG